jgi:AcrR family transcriptional regulator
MARHSKLNVVKTLLIAKTVGRSPHVAAPVRRMPRRVSPEVGLRELNKIEKRQSIRQAARELFSKYGYEETTLRQIAQRAHVGLGTLFNYAQDKRDLVFLICNEELAQVLDEALESVEALPPDRTLVDRIIELYRRHYEYFSKDVAISRLALKEFGFIAGGKQAEAFYTTAWRLMHTVEALVRKAQKEGEIEPSEDAATVGHLIFLVVSGAIRWWITGRFPEPNAGLAELRGLLELQFHGFRHGSNSNSPDHAAPSETA